MRLDCDGETGTAGAESVFKEPGGGSEEVMLEGLVLFYFVFKIKQLEYIYMLMRVSRDK